MHKGDKAPEPTMEEILASIRKIIAEEPIGSRPGPVPGGAGDEEPGALPMGGSSGLSRGNDPVLPLPSRNDSDSDGSAYSVEEALSELMDDRPQRRAPVGRDEPALKPQARPAPAAEDDNQRPSWLFRNQTGSPASPAQEGAASGAGPARASGLLSQLESTRQVADRGAGDAGAATPKAPAALKPTDAGTASDRPRDTGRSGLTDFFSSAQGQSNEIPKPSAHRVPARDGRSDPIAQPSATPAVAPRPEPAAAQGRPFESLISSGLQSASPRQDAAGQAGSPDLRRQASLLQPETAKETKAAAAPAADPGRPKNAASPQAATSAAGVGVSKPEKPESREAARSDSMAIGASSPNPGSRTLEDTVADLLRPMLREWLDSNLPRIVEKAIRVEMAARAKPQDSDEGQRS